MEAFLPTAADPDNRRLGTRSAQKKNGDQEDAQDLGDKCAFFKRSAVTSLGVTQRPFFEEACDLCTPLSKSTLRNGITPQHGLSSALQPSLWKPIFERGPAQTGTLTKTEFLQLLIRDEVTAMLLEKEYGKESLAGPVEVERLVDELEIDGDPDTNAPRHRWATYTISAELSPNGVIYHPGELEVLKACQESRVPFLFLPTFHDYSDLLLISLFLEKVLGLTTTKILLDEDPPPRQPKWLWQEMRYFKRLEDYQPDLNYYIEHFALLRQLVNGNSFLIHLQSDWRSGPTARSLEKLDHFVEAIELQEIEDLLAVPVSVSYELPPNEVHLSDLRKAPNHLTRLTFNQPFSIREFRWNTTWSNDPTYTLADHVLATAHSQTRISATEILSYVFQRQEFSSLDLGQVVSQFQKVRQDILFRKGDVGFSGETEDVVDRTIRLLGKFIRLESNGKIYMNAQFQDTAKRLAHNVFSFYAVEAIIVTASMALMKLKVPLRGLIASHCELPSIDLHRLIGLSGMLHHLLKERFHVVRPCQDFPMVFNDAFVMLTADGLYVQEEDMKRPSGQHLQERVSQRLARAIDQACDDDTANLEQVPYVKFCLTAEAVDRAHELIRVLQPYTKAFRNLLISLQESTADGLEIGKAIDESDAVQRYCLQRLLNLKVIERTSADPSTVKLAKETIAEDHLATLLNHVAFLVL